MDTKLEARGQFPASFPDTFKNFFAMMNEDEDHVGLFANLLEDKVIPRHSSPVVPAQRQRYGGSMRSHSGGDSSGRADRLYSQLAQGQQHNMSVYHTRSRSGSGGSGPDLVSALTGTRHNNGNNINGSNNGNNSLGRSRAALSYSANGLNTIEHASNPLGQDVSSSSGGSLLDIITLSTAGAGEGVGLEGVGLPNDPAGGSNASLQNQNNPKSKSKSKTSSSTALATTSAADRPSTSAAASASASASSSGNVQVCKHIQYCCLHQESASTSQQAQSADSGQKHVTLACDCERVREKNKRLGPDGEDNCGGVIKLQGYVYGYTPPMVKPSPKSKSSKPIKILPPSTSSDEPRSSSPTATAAAKNKSLQERQERGQARHSVILERAFDFDASCDESDNHSVISSIQEHRPVPSPAPHQLAYNVLKPILKQPQKQQHQQLPVHHHPQQQLQPLGHPKQQQQQQLQQQPGYPKQHRMLPTPPTHSGLGAYHTREAALQRVQQQSGFGSRNNLTTVPSGAMPYSQGPSTSAAAAAAYQAYNQALEQSMELLQQVQFEPQQPQVQFVQLEVLDPQLQFEPHQQPYGEDEHFLEQQQQYEEELERQHQLQLIQDHQQHLKHQPTQHQQFPEDLPPQYSDEWEYSTDSNQVPPLTTYSDFLNAAQNPTGSRSLRAQKSPIINRRRASSIAGNLLHSDYHYSTRNSIGGAPVDADEFQRISHSSSARDRMSLAGVLTFQQAMSGAVSPQYGPVGLDPAGAGSGTGAAAGDRERDRDRGGGGLVSGLGNVSGGLPGGSVHNLSLGVGLGFLGGSSSTLAAVAEVTSGPDATSSDSLSPVTATPGTTTTIRPTAQAQLPLQQQQQQQRERGVGVGESFGGGSASNSNMANLANAAAISSSTQPGRTFLERQRLRTSSMPAESRRPRLAEMRRSAIHAGDLDMGYYRLRSFSITSHGICNLGDSLRSRRSRSINSVTSTGTSNSGVDRHNSNASRASGEVVDGDPTASGQPPDGDPNVPAYKIAMLGGSGVGKTTLTYQFTTSDYICAYDLSLDDDYGQKTVSVLVDNIETDLEIIDHPACEMSTEAFCATYNIDLFVVVYSVVDRTTFKAAERVLQYLKENEMLLSRGAILVANKTDLERHRVVTRQMGCKVANQIACKFIETSSGLDHNVDELLVGIVAQVKLNPQRLRRLTELELQRLNLQSTIQKHRGMHLQTRRMVRQMSVCHGDEEIFNGGQPEEHECEWQEQGPEGRKARVENPNRKPLNLESILKMGESEVEDGDVPETTHHHHYHQQQLSKFELLTANDDYRHRIPRRQGFRKRRSFDGAISTSTAAAAVAELQRRHELRALDDSHILDEEERMRNRYRDRERDRESEDEEAEGPEGPEGGGGGGRRSSCNRKVVKKLTARTKVFISSVLRFKKSINLRRRNSSSCSDLFVI